MNGGEFSSDSLDFSEWHRPWRVTIPGEVSCREGRVMLVHPADASGEQDRLMGLEVEK